ncbi:hypothetical protein TNCT_519561 [Trichonephila clavata]|uniref:Uncharacterized protein n=1 Tax=Trichonephila clavata TaxID=2740835 RepID=A0A8X6IPW8_TRICU|nr:hypothetical protein TNCT_519561 [Trichonephila clavata]
MLQPMQVKSEGILNRIRERQEVEKKTSVRIREDLMFDRLSSRQHGEGFFNSWEKGKVEISEGRIRVGLPNLNSGVRLLWIPARGDCNALVYVKSCKSKLFI